MGYGTRRVESRSLAPFAAIRRHPAREVEGGANRAASGSNDLAACTSTSHGETDWHEVNRRPLECDVR